MAVFKNVTRLYSYTRAFFWYVMSIKKETNMHDLRRKHGDLLTMLSQKTTENFLYGMYFFHIITTTLDQWTRSFVFPLLEL